MQALLQPNEFGSFVGAGLWHTRELFTLLQSAPRGVAGFGAHSGVSGIRCNMVWRQMTGLEGGAAFVVTWCGPVCVAHMAARPSL